MVVELADLTLPRRDSKASGEALRRFWCNVVGWRSSLQLPPEMLLTWDVIGFVPPEGATLATTSLHAFLQRTRMRLALPGDVFKKPGGFEKRLEAMKRKGDEAKIRWGGFCPAQSGVHRAGTPEPNSAKARVVPCPSSSGQACLGPAVSLDRRARARGDDAEAQEGEEAETEEGEGSVRVLQAC